MKYCLLLLASVAFLSAGCKSSTAPDGSNTIAGLVVLYDSTGYADSTAMALSDFSGVDISIDGTSRKAITDRNGHFEFDNVPNGTYDITATKLGMGTYHWYEKQVIGGRTDLPEAALARMRHNTPTLDILFTPIFRDRYFLLNASLSQYYIGAYIQYYVDRDSTIAADAIHVATSDLTSSGSALYLFINDLRTAGFNSGDTIYLSCSTVFGGTSSYVDVRRHQTRYSSCGPRSNVVMAVMP